MTMQVVKEVLTDASDAAAPAAFMHFISWLASQFAHLVKPIRQASHGERSQVHQQQQQSSLSAIAAVPLSADFYFFATLLQPLLSHLQSLDANPNSNGAGVHLQMEGTGAHVEANGSHSAASKSTKQMKGKKQEVKKTNGVPIAWHIAAEGAALLVWDNLSSSVHNMYSLGFAKPPRTLTRFYAGSLPCPCIDVHLSLTTDKVVCPCLMSSQCLLAPCESCTGELIGLPAFSCFQKLTVCSLNCHEAQA